MKDDTIDELLEELDSNSDLSKSEQSLRIQTEERRYGKAVTIVEGFDMDQTDISSLASDLKSQVAAGGTVEDGRIELQGDHRDALPGILKEHGYNVER
ncbi:stress response translation initiation inhibitor YciH [Salinarchaeum sp. IM2453]|uniref:stress response translation initiation inhibitor YciH n=1 Tax=Salinarchaeum sp. IM2453 TaxID=2862870 RepID=UPI001C829035|nr:stress response translation initiation inhibitor YciH [Salinarchaeum sp. IM2453]QZA88200.1 stress response translation initiation inhibitor YciH [Salinarchaeum sp. IM2453]